MNNDDIRVVQFDDEVVTLMESAGMTCQLTQSNREEVARALALQASPITMCKWMWDAFWEGAEELGLRTLLRAHPGKQQHANIKQIPTFVHTFSGNHLKLKFRQYPAMHTNHMVLRCGKITRYMSTVGKKSRRQREIIYR